MQKTNKNAVSEYMAKIGRKGGKARAKKLTPLQRQTIAAMGAQARERRRAAELEAVHS